MPLEKAFLAKFHAYLRSLPGKGYNLTPHELAKVFQDFKDNKLSAPAAPELHIVGDFSPDLQAAMDALLAALDEYNRQNRACYQTQVDEGQNIVNARQAIVQADADMNIAIQSATIQAQQVHDIAVSDAQMSIGGSQDLIVECINNRVAALDVLSQAQDTYLLLFHRDFDPQMPTNP